MHPLVLRRRTTWLALLGIAASACGQSVRADGGSRDAGAEADADATSAPTNCAYPRAGQIDAEFTQKIAALARADCRYQLGEPKELPFTPTRSAAARYAFSFDANGDDINDIFFWEPATGSQFGTLALATSVVSAGELSYARQDCDALSAIPYGRAFVRDLNGDSVPDLIVGREVRAFLNHPEGFKEVFTEPVRGDQLLIDVAVADLGGAAEDLNDIAWGYDLVRDNPNEIEVEWGAAVARLDALPPTPAHRLSTWAYPNDGRPVVDASGEFALGSDALGTWLFVADVRYDTSGGPASGLVVRRRGGDFSELPVELETPTLPLAGDPVVVDAWAVPWNGAGDVLATLYDGLVAYPSAVALYDLSDPALGVLPLLEEFSAVEVHSFNRSFGGGDMGSIRWMIDANGDGNVDFLEREGRSELGLRHLTFHRGLDGGGFGEPWTIDVSTFIDQSAESPFVAAGGVPVAITVNDVAFEGEDVTGPATFQVFECAPE